MCVNATDPKRIRLFLKGSKKLWNIACMCVSICYLAVHMLSLTVLPESGAEDKSRNWLSMIHPCYLRERGGVKRQTEERRILRYVWKIIWRFQKMRNTKRRKERWIEKSRGEEMRKEERVEGLRRRMEKRDQLSELFVRVTDLLTG